MAALTWDDTGEHFYETGVDHGVLYIPDAQGNYNTGFAWNGLTAVTESPSGAEATALYADNIKYLNMLSAEEFGGTIEAYTYPDEFGQCDGSAEPSPGVLVGQQQRRSFGLSYRTRVGNDIEGADLGYKLHLVYGAVAAPSEKAYNTINDSPEAITFSWEMSTTPIPVDGYKPTSLLVIDSTKVSATALADLETLLYGSGGVEPQLPPPNGVLAIFGGTVVEVTPTAPTYVAPIITIPAITGVDYLIDGSVVASGAQPAITVDTLVTARPQAGYKFPAVVDNDWLFEV